MASTTQVGLAFMNTLKRSADWTSRPRNFLGCGKIAESAGWWLPYQNICWVSERHSIVKRDASGKLHCTDGPALEYPDGFCVFAYHGQRYPECKTPDDFQSALMVKRLAGELVAA